MTQYDLICFNKFPLDKGRNPCYRIERQENQAKQKNSKTTK